MAKMKQLMVDLIEFEDEIEEVFDRVRELIPFSFNDFISEDLSDETRRFYLRQFTNDKELIELALVALDLKRNEMSEM